jgi:molecular chaperone GrpE
MSKNENPEEKDINIEGGNTEEQTSDESAATEAQEEKEETAEQTEGEDTKADETDKKSDQPAEEKDPLAEANAKIDELKDKYLRTVAEFDNYRKRTNKEKAELIFNGGEKTISAILPVLDDFERAITNNEKVDDPKALKEGVEIIFKKFVKTMEGLGVKKIETEGKDFDVDYHEAIAMVPGMGDDKKGKVIDCVQTGYTLNDKVIRHAKVAVGQ